MKKIYKGTDNFYKLVTQSDFIIDKSLFIKELINLNEDTILITRPRRWGKSINLDMLKRFINIEVDKHGEELKINPNRVLFEGGEIELGRSEKKIFNKLEIAKTEGDFMQDQGKSPVILLNLKECKGNNKEEAIASINDHIQEFFGEYKYLIRSNNIDDDEKNLFQSYLRGEVNDEKLKRSLSFLSKLLHDHFKKPVWILIDEHDKPGSHFLTLKNFQDLSEDRYIVTCFITSMVARCGKGNKYVYKTVLTGVTDFIIREGSSGFNNIGEVYDINNMVLSDYYGLSKTEILHLIQHIGIKESYHETVLEQLKEWYDGYVTRDSNNNKVSKYNIWSVINHVVRVTKEGVEIKPLCYWSNSAMNDIFENIGNLGVDDDFISMLHRLSNGDQVKLPIPSRDFSFMGNIGNPHAKNMLVSYLLLHYGYLNERDNQLIIPSHEVDKYFRERILQIWINYQFRELKLDNNYDMGYLGHDLCQNLLDKDVFINILSEKLLNKIQGGDKSEQYFQSIIGGAIELYSIYNNKIAHYSTGIEKTSGKIGRIDNIFYPLNLESPENIPVIIHEYKKVDRTCGNDEEIIESSMWQIFEKGYMSEPLTKLRIHNQYYDFKIVRIRGVLLIRDDHFNKWSSHLKERDLDIKTATKMVDFMKSKIVIDTLQLSNSKRNVDKIKQGVFDKFKVKNIEEFVKAFEGESNISDLIALMDNNKRKLDNIDNLEHVETQKCSSSKKKMLTSNNIELNQDVEQYQDDTQGDNLLGVTQDIHDFHDTESL